MRVGFDAHMIGQRETGNETYALGLLHGLQTIDFPVDVYAYAPPPEPLHRFHHIGPRQSLIRIPLVTPLAVRRDNLDLFHATYVLPPYMSCLGIVTVHDITFALFPQWFHPRVRATLQALVPLSLRRAQRVIVISHHTKADIVERYNISPESIDVIHLAPRPAFSQPLHVERAAEPFFLYVGNVEPRKNIETVIRAIAVLRDRKRPVRLVVAGNPGLGVAETRTLVRTLALEEWVTFAGYVPDGELRRLYATCTALVHPALYEGFGLTLLEAMVQSTPVIAARTSSVPEVTGDAAVLVDAESIEAWTEAMQTLLGDAACRTALGQRGRERAALFSWTRCAEETVNTYRMALQAASRMDYSGGLYRQKG